MDYISLKNNIINTLKNEHLKQIPSVPVLRSATQKPFFIFSPILVVYEKFLSSDEHDIEFIIQPCVRSLESYKLKYNPIVSNFQELLSIFSYKHRKISDYVSLFDELNKTFLSLEKNNIYWQVESTNSEVKKALRQNDFYNIIDCKSEQLRCHLPDITQSAFYLKVLYEYRNGLVPICNFVLIDQEQDCCRLDCAIFLERLHFIMNQQDHVYDTELYSSLVKFFSEKSIPYIESCRLSSLLRTSLFLLLNGVLPESKRGGYFTRKILREFFAFCYTHDFDVNSEIDNLLQFGIDCLIKIGTNIDIVHSEEVKRIITCEYTQWKTTQQKGIELAAKKIQHLSYVDRNGVEMLKDTYGIHEEVLKRIVKQSGMNFEGNPNEIEYSNRFLPYPFDRTRDFTPSSWFSQSRFSI
ncbi:alanine--tRNA ligase-related protein [Anoxybacillus sp. ST4]|uniref:alanine--tRNA ligase-related protein n=1 Tax=Anoxybacillus sp. ST4 TaxID=2864181 RepID=UPI001C642FBA|nr:alanine--tRNA ligase-related protein [Anoxybacillus sp. ST4]MBW7650710.1 hypothetical protein [Anoxybacillus sp. ST4]